MPKTIIVTGASDGIGEAAARRLAADGHDVIAVGHDKRKTETLAAELGVAFFTADYLDLGSVGALAGRLLETCPKIDALANNAGVILNNERALTKDGHERTFQINYLAGFLLTMRLLGRLLESKGAVIFTSSIANKLYGHIDLGDLENRNNFRAMKAYGDSKIAVILLARELKRRYGENGLSTAAFHPGMVRTNISHEKGAALKPLYQTPIKYLWTVSPERGADTLVFLAEGRAGEDFPSGEYFVRRKKAKANPQAYDGGLGRALWEKTVGMLGLPEGR